MVRSSLLDARDEIEDVRAQLAAGDVDDARRSLGRLQVAADLAAQKSGGPLWALAQHVPVLGADVRAVREAVRALDEGSDEVAPAGLAVAEAVADDQLAVRDATLPIATLRRLIPDLEAAAGALQRIDNRLVSVEVDALHGPVRSVFEDLVDDVSTAAAAARSAATSTSVLVEALGGDERRDWLLVVQNNAELRSTGGMFGSWSLLSSEGGKLEFTAQGSAGDIQTNESPVVNLTDGERQVYGPEIGRRFSDVNLSPDFPRVAGMAAAMFDEAPPKVDGVGTKVDGVIAIDPVALSYLLDEVGSVRVAVPGGDRIALTGDRVVEYLLHDVYQDLDRDQQNEFFERVARAAFLKIFASGSDPRGLLSALSKAASEARLLVAFRDETLQSQISGTRTAGDIGPDHGRPEIGVYLNDAQASKMDWFLRMESDLEAKTCSDDGVQSLETKVVLSSTAPKGGKGLSDSVTGPADRAGRGTILVNLRLYSPVGGRVDRLFVDGKRVVVAGGEHLGRRVAVVPVELSPGQEIEIEAELTSGSGQDSDPVLRSTPTARSGATVLEAPSACG